GDGTSQDTGYHQNATSQNLAYFTHAFAPGSWTVVASGADAAGNPVSAAMQVVVYPQLAPAVSATPSATDPQTVTYGGSVTGGDGHVLAMRWTFADGTAADGATVTHSFPPGVTPGATLTVVDGTGSAASASG
ncbi:MAG TPA: PKD domain-containing protein, partial [Mycobacteriales bacterium]|nr:PKD domain-containing protein [Mycobacteriales bacterium]